MRWYKKQALSGRWSAYVQAASEDEVRVMHELSKGNDRRDPCTIECMPENFVPFNTTFATRAPVSTARKAPARSTCHDGYLLVLPLSHRA